ncbi:MAG: DNA polymerase III subunit beta [Candidatus Epulonipiscioides saccharophilum]|nr:MAG: DNA polymerase III subunit beta [Epulopiscium sp. AS2M-Bin001]
MKFLCNQNTLSQAINIVIKACPARSVNPILECILITAEDEKIILVGNNLELGIKNIINGKTLENGQIAVDAKLFSEMIRKMPPGDIEITTISKNQITIINQKSKFTLQTFDVKQFTDLPSVSLAKSFVISQAELKNIIKRTIFSVAQEESRPSLTGEKLEIENGQLNLVAIDGFRIAFMKLHLEDKNLKIGKIIPAKTLLEVTKILGTDKEKDDTVRLCFGDDHVLFNFSDTTVVSRLIEGEFLRYQDIFSNDFETRIIIDREKLLMSVERAALISREDGKNPVRLEINKDTLIVTSNTTMGESFEELAITLRGQPLKIAFNPRYLIDALKNIDDEQVYVNFVSKMAPAVIMPIEGDRYRYLILPIRVNES